MRQTKQQLESLTTPELVDLALLRLEESTLRLERSHLPKGIKASSAEITDRRIRKIRREFEAVQAGGHYLEPAFRASLIRFLRRRVP